MNEMRYIPNGAWFNFGDRVRYIGATIPRMAGNGAKVQNATGTITLPDNGAVTDYKLRRFYGVRFDHDGREQYVRADELEGWS